MEATQFIQLCRDPGAWTKHSRALRSAGDAIWEKFEGELLLATSNANQTGKPADYEAAAEALESAKLLYGLALETGLKAHIISKSPESIEIRVIMNGAGDAVQAELRSIGTPSSQGHNILALAEAAGVFGEQFKSVVRTESDVSAIKNICRELGEVVTWRGRYPVPLASFEPKPLDPKVPRSVLAHYLRDFLDPLLDFLHRSQNPHN